jgi:hypothetical protein
MKNKVIISSNTAGSSEEKKATIRPVTRSLNFFRSRFLLIYLTGLDLFYTLYK